MSVAFRYYKEKGLNIIDITHTHLYKDSDPKTAHSLINIYMYCKYCNKQLKQIEGKRQKQYCNDACRMAYKRTINTEQTITEQPKTNTEQAIPNITTDKDRTGKKIKGYCHGCGRDIIDIKEQWVDGKGDKSAAKSICICLPCVRKGVTHKSLGLKMCG